MRKTTLARVMALASLVCHGLGREESATTSCSLADPDRPDPNLHILDYDIGEGPQTLRVYVEPDASTFYRDSSTEGCPATEEKIAPTGQGVHRQGKFSNLSNQTVIFSVPAGTDKKRHVEYLDPWESIFLTIYAAHHEGGDDNHVVVTTTKTSDDDTNVLAKFQIHEYADNSIYTYDPYHIKVHPDPPSFLSVEHQQQYRNWRQRLSFHETYLAKTGRSYLPHLVRPQPRHFMWPAEYIGQEHWITSKQTHFTEFPPPELLGKIEAVGKERRVQQDERPVLSDYRDNTTPYLNLTLRVLSVAPRVLEISNFLSPKEVEHLLWMELAKRFSMRGQSAMINLEIFREDSIILDAIYRRAADLQRVDEALMRARDDDERPDVPGVSSLAESLELVHYSEGQDSARHTDFTSERIMHSPQEARFSTLLLYLNEPEEGGETSFPNAKTYEALDIKPELGKAVLFYSMLPDGNLDEKSLHFFKPVTEGTNYVTKLWLWNPEGTDKV
eukprot:scaffold7281_cov171-Amphora_coffeaeformis.AAC.4